MRLCMERARSGAVLLRSFMARVHRAAGPETARVAQAVVGKLGEHPGAGRDPDGRGDKTRRKGGGTRGEKRRDWVAVLALGHDPCSPGR